MRPAPPASTGGRYAFSVATAADEPWLRERSRRDVVEGDLAFTMRREPCYFSACRIHGNEVQTLIGRDKATGEVVAMASRGIGTAFVDGEPARTAYLSDLRIEKGHRGGRLLARLYKAAGEAHALDPVPTYLLIDADNQASISQLTSRRAGLPWHRPRGKLRAMCIRLAGRRPVRVDPGTELRRATVEELPQVIDFLNHQRAMRFGAPVLRPGDFLESGRCGTLGARDFLVARRHGRLLGTLALWDQSPLRQLHVERYPAGTLLQRHLHNLAARWMRVPRLPAPGGILAGHCLAFFCVAPGEVAAGSALLRSAVNELAGGPWPYALASIHEDDVLAPLLGDYRGISSEIALYEVHFDGAAAPPAFPGAVPGVEIALA